MSRIETALRRASAAAHGGAVVVEKSKSALSGELILAQFPAEDVPVTDDAKPRVPPVLAQRQPGGAAPGWDFPANLAGKLVLGDAPPLAVEQYRRLAATLHELRETHGTKTLMVTSALPGEGKTLTVVNLALTLSESYRFRVLLVDADLRRPSVHEMFGLRNRKGLAEGLRSDTGELSLVTITPHLSVLPGGRPDSNPMAGLTSDRMRRLLEEAASAFDWVLLDAPPVGIMPDAHLLARVTEGVIFVIAAGSTPFPLVDRAINEIGRESIVGTVLNRIDEVNIPATGYYGDYYGSPGREQPLGTAG